MQEYNLACYLQYGLVHCAKKRGVKLQFPDMQIKIDDKVYTLPQKSYVYSTHRGHQKGVFGYIKGILGYYDKIIYTLVFA